MLNEVFIQGFLLYALLAISIQVTLRAGVFSVAGVGFWGLGAYGVGILTIRGVPVLLALLIVLVVCGVVGFLLARLLVRLRGLYFAMATVAFVLILGVVVLNTREFTGGAAGLYGVPIVASTWQLVVALVLVVLIAQVSQVRLLGRAYRALSEDQPLAESLAIDTARMRSAAFVFSALVGGLAGGLNALTFGLATPEDLSFGLIVVALTMVILGGYHSWLGAVIGAFAVRWLPIGFQDLASVANLLYGLTVIVIAVYAPKGLLGVIERLISWLQGRIRGRKRVASDSRGA